MDNDSADAVEVLDLRGLKCPLPALLAKRALMRAAAGTSFDVIADDPLAAIDIPHMCAQEAFEVVASRREGQLVRLTLRRPSALASERPRDPDGR
jgi:tRNA 2-thiouridine synthesizing protein A